MEGTQVPWCIVHDHGRTLEPGLLRVSVRWQTSISSKFCLKSDTDILKEREVDYSLKFPTRCPDGGFCSFFTAVHESQRWCEAPPTVPELSILPAHSLQSFLLLHAHSVPLWPAQTQSDRGILHLGLNSTLSLVMCKSYLLVFLLLISNPFISLQGPSHSVLPQGFRIRTMSATPWVVFTWQRKFQTEVFTNLLRKLLKLTIWRLGTCKQQMILTGWCFRPHVSKIL